MRGEVVIATKFGFAHNEMEAGEIVHPAFERGSSRPPSR